MRIFTFATLLSLSVSAQAAEPFDPPVADKHKPTQAFEAQVYESDDSILFSIPEKKIQYYITKPNNPAHPYIIENKVLGRDNDTRFRANGYGAADNKAAAKWLEEINRINNDRMAKLKGN